MAHQHIIGYSVPQIVDSKNKYIRIKSDIQKSRMVYLSGAGLPRLSWKKGCHTNVVVVLECIKYRHVDSLLKMY